MRYREPYVGFGATGARASATIDLEEHDSLDPGDPRRPDLVASASEWLEQARQLEAAERIDVAGMREAARR